MVRVKTISALELRAKVGQYLDEAAKGERIIVERAGQRLCAIVPLEDVDRWDPDRRMARQLAALDELRRINRVHPTPSMDSAAIIQQMRRDRDRQILRNAGPEQADPDPDPDPEAGR